MAATAIPRALRTGPHKAAHRRRTTARIPARLDDADARLRCLPTAQQVHNEAR
jgi:hypothetical protein